MPYRNPVPTSLNVSTGSGKSSVTRGWAGTGFVKSDPLSPISRSLVFAEYCSGPATCGSSSSTTRLTGSSKPMLDGLLGVMRMPLRPTALSAAPGAAGKSSTVCSAGPERRTVPRWNVAGSVAPVGTV